jgi:RNA polymerase sigma factor (sigma-70 family)
VLDLIARARTGDREAFGQLVASSIDRLYAVAARLTRDPYRAEDAVQTAFLKAWRDLPSLRDASRFDAWVYRLVVRACLDEGRRHRTFVANIQVVSHEPGVADGSAGFADRDQVARAFSRLPMDQRAVIVLHHFEDLPLTRVAETIGIPVGTARSRLHYALRALRAAIEADDRPVLPEGQRA